MLLMFQGLGLFYARSSNWWIYFIILRNFGMQVSEFGMHIANIGIENHFHINDILILHA